MKIFDVISKSNNFKVVVERMHYLITFLMDEFPHTPRISSSSWIGNFAYHPSSYFSSANLNTLSNLKTHELIKSIPFETNQPQNHMGQVVMLDGRELHSYVITPSHPPPRILLHRIKIYASFSAYGPTHLSKYESSYPSTLKCL